MRINRSLSVLACVALAATLSACGSEDGASSGTTYQVQAGDSSCDVSDTTLPAGKATFEVENTGSDVTEVYVYGEDGGDFTKIVGEKENIGPGTSQKFSVDLAAGKYEVACKPGMTGDGIRTALTVTGAGGGAGAEAESAYDKELEFEVSAAGEAQAPQDLSSGKGDKVELKLHNHHAEEFYLTVTSPSGEQIGKGAAEGGSDAEFIVALPDAGTYVVKVYQEDHEAQATPFELPVTE